MTYIENIFLCLAIPMILSLFFIKGRSRSYTLFVTIGMGICLLSAYVNSFFMWLYGVDGTVAAIEITPVCEELLKLLPSRSRENCLWWQLPLPQVLQPLKMHVT